MTSRAGAAAIDSARASVFLAKADADLPDTELASLRDRADAQLGITTEFLQDALSRFGLPPAVVPRRAASQGTFHRLFEIDAPGDAPRLLRVATLAGEAGSQLMDLERRLATYLRERDFPVPACAFRDVNGRGVHLLDRAHGASLTDLEGDEPAMLRALGEVGRFLARLHAAGGTGFGHLSLAGLEASPPQLRGVLPDWNDHLRLRLDEHLRLCVACGAMTQAETRRALAHFDALEPLMATQPAALLHGDPGSHNFIVQDGAIAAVIDWEDALLGDPLFDLASLCTFHPERRHAAIFAGYGVPLAAGSGEWTRFWLYFLRIALAKTVHRARFGYGDRPDRPPPSRRIQLALERLEVGA